MQLNCWPGQVQNTSLHMRQGCVLFLKNAKATVYSLGLMCQRVFTQPSSARVSPCIFVIPPRAGSGQWCSSKDGLIASETSVFSEAWRHLGWDPSAFLETFTQERTSWPTSSPQILLVQKSDLHAETPNSSQRVSFLPSPGARLPSQLARLPWHWQPLRGTEYPWGRNSARKIIDANVRQGVLGGRQERITL